MNPTIGRIVNYTTTPEDLEKMNQANNNTDGCNLQKQLPAIIVAVWSENLVNLKVICDGNLELWKTSVGKGDLEGQWDWPKRVS